MKRGRRGGGRNQFGKFIPGQSGDQPDAQFAAKQSVTVGSVEKTAGIYSAAIRILLDRSGSTAMGTAIAQRFKKPQNLVHLCMRLAQQPGTSIESNVAAVLEHCSTTQRDELSRALAPLSAMDLDESWAADPRSRSQEVVTAMLEYFALYAEDGAVEQYYGKWHPEVTAWIDDLVQELFRTQLEKQDPTQEAFKDRLFTTVAAAHNLGSVIASDSLTVEDTEMKHAHPLFMGTDQVHQCIVIRLMEMVADQYQLAPDVFSDFINRIQARVEAMQKELYKFKRLGEGAQLVHSYNSMMRVAYALRASQTKVAVERLFPTLVADLSAFLDSQETAVDESEDQVTSRGFAVVAHTMAEGGCVSYVYDGGRRREMLTSYSPDDANHSTYRSPLERLCPNGRDDILFNRGMVYCIDGQYAYHQAGQLEHPVNLTDHDSADEVLTGTLSAFRSELQEKAARYPELFAIMHSWGPFYFVNYDGQEFLYCRAPDEDRLLEICYLLGKEDIELVIDQGLLARAGIAVDGNETWYVIPIGSKVEETEVEQTPSSDDSLSAKSVPPKNPRAYWFKQLREQFDPPTLDQVVSCLKRVAGVEDVVNDPTYGKGGHGSVVIKFVDQKRGNERKNTFKTTQKKSATLPWPIVIELVDGLGVDRQAFYEAAERQGGIE